VTSVVKRTSASILSLEPPIIYVRPRPRPFGLATIAATELAARSAIVIVRVMWSLEIAYRLAYVAGAYHLYRKRHPGLRLIVAANTEKEVENLRRVGVEAIDANHNIFVDETVFKPMPDVEPKFDAVYNANFSPFKRRHLAAEIPSCLHIGYVADPAKRAQQLTELAKAKAQFPHHHFANEALPDRIRRLYPFGVNANLALARVGLCLSAVEGAMTSSMEYLLAGLPIVSTPSRGGRDRYFLPETSLIVEPKPGAVREAVASLIARDIPRDHVREQALKIIAPQRRAFNAFIAELRRGHPPTGSDPRWSFDYVPNLHQLRPVTEFLERIGIST
jgi:glycosyltransferase involved in cell wall biosynthesis